MDGGRSEPGASRLVCLCSFANRRLVQVFLAVPADGNGDRRTCLRLHSGADALACRQQHLGRTDTRRRSGQFTFAWPHVRSTRRRTRTEPRRRRRKVDAMGVRQMLQVYGRGAIMGAARCERGSYYFMFRCSFTINQRKCPLKHPPGRKVYQRGAHIIWELDGAKQKVRLISLDTTCGMPTCS